MYPSAGWSNRSVCKRRLLGVHEQGKTLIVVTHDDEVAARAEKVVHIRDGRVKEITIN
jgi:putative ABC transport system ATP-binding protein